MSKDFKETKSNLSENSTILLHTRSNVSVVVKCPERTVEGILSLIKSTNDYNEDFFFHFTPESEITLSDLKVYQKKNEDEHGQFQLNTRDFNVLNDINYDQISSNNGILTFQLIYLESIEVGKPTFDLACGLLYFRTKTKSGLTRFFFHRQKKKKNTNPLQSMVLQFEQYNENGEPFWDSQEFVKSIMKYIPLKQSVNKNMYFVVQSNGNISEVKMESKDKKSDNKHHLNNIKSKMLNGLASFSFKTQKLVLNFFENNITSIKKNQDKEGDFLFEDEFDCARVYLANWEQKVREEAILNQKRLSKNKNLAFLVGIEENINKYFYENELLNAKRGTPISEKLWNSFFNKSGHFIYMDTEIKELIFRSGLEDIIRQEVWPFLLGLFPWNTSSKDRIFIKNNLKLTYESLKSKWLHDQKKQNSSKWQIQKNCIDKDIFRTDRSLPLFRDNKKKSNLSLNEYLSPSFEINNCHLLKMREILFTYNEFNHNLGYVQGMSDLLSPLYVILHEDYMIFWCYVNFMERMEKNFVMSQSGIKDQMSLLNKLLQFMDPDLYNHLEKCESSGLFFFFRMLLVWFKREFKWDQLLRLWEVLWTDYYSSNFHLFFALSILTNHKDTIILNLNKSHEVLKYFNNLSFNLDLDLLLVRAEFLFLKLKRMIDIIDSEKSSGLSLKNYDSDFSSLDLSSFVQDLRILFNRKVLVEKEVENTNLDFSV